jgi:hypothetical protein
MRFRHLLALLALTVVSVTTGCHHWRGCCGGCCACNCCSCCYQGADAPMHPAGPPPLAGQAPGAPAMVSPVPMVGSH